MLIKKIEIKNFKRLADPVVIDGLSSGINILAGDNEEGKSTLLRALRAVFFQKYNASGQAIKDMQPYNAAVRPEVGVEFELAGSHYSLRKVFAQKQAQAEFASEKHKCNGSEVEEKIRELFSLPNNEKGKQDTGIWGLLWLEQTAATRGLETSEGARETLMKALDADLGAVVGGEKGRVLLKQIKTEYAKYYTPAAEKETGEYKKAIVHLEEISDQFDNCQERYQTYELKLETLAETQEKLNKFEHNRSLENAQKAHSDAQEKVHKAERLAIELKSCKTTENAAVSEWNTAKEKLSERLSLGQKLEAAKQDLASNTEALEKARAQSKKLETDLSAKEAVLAEKKKAFEDAEQACKKAERLDEYQRLLDQEKSLTDDLKELTDLQATLAGYEDRKKEIKISEHGLEKLRDLESQMNEARIRAEVSATKLTARPDSGKQASINGKKVEANTEFVICQKTTLALSEWGEIDVSPGGENIAQFQETAKTQQELFEKQLGSYGVASLDEAASLLTELRQLNVDIGTASKEIRRICGTDGVDGLRKTLSAIEKQLANYADLKGEQFTDSLASLREQRDEARKNEAAAAKERDEAKSTTETIDRQIAALNESFSLRQISVKELEDELSAPDKTLEQLEQDEKQKADLAIQAQNTRKLKEKEIGDNTPELLQKELDEAARKLKEIDIAVRKLNDDIREARAFITAVGQTGLDEERRQLEGEKERAQQACNRMHSRARAIKLLYKTLSTAEQEAKSQYLEPMLEILRPQLNDFFPGSQLILDSKAVEILHLERDGNKENYNDLSVGTREQLSVLTRLAIARLLKQQGQPGVLVLDDALVYSDDTRISKMKKLLQDVGKEIQILILTCRLRDYSDIEGAKIIELSSCKNLSTASAARK